VSKILILQKTRVWATEVLAFKAEFLLPGLFTAFVLELPDTGQFSTHAFACDGESGLMLVEGANAVYPAGVMCHSDLLVY